MSLLKLQFEAAISAKLALITYTFVDNLPLTKILKILIFVYFSNCFMTHLLIISLSSRTSIPGQPLGLPKKYGCLEKKRI